MGLNIMEHGTAKDLEEIFFPPEDIEAEQISLEEWQREFMREDEK